jgi:hypothetical protein
VEDATPVTRRVALGATAAGVASLAVLGLTAQSSQAADPPRPPDKFVQLQRAYDGLIVARDNLKAAGPFGGQRDIAIGLVNQALDAIAEGVRKAGS